MGLTHWACTVCGQATEETQGAYIAMTVFLSAVPLLMIAAGWVWVIRRMREAEKNTTSLAEDKKN